jgi:hypothetical protein
MYTCNGLSQLQTRVNLQVALRPSFPTVLFNVDGPSQKDCLIWARWHTPVIPALGRWRQEKFQTSLGYTVRPCLKTPKEETASCPKPHSRGTGEV